MKNRKQMIDDEMGYFFGICGDTLTECEFRRGAG